MPYADPEKEKAYKRQWAKANRDKQRGYERAWRERQNEKPIEERWAAQRAWNERNPERHRAAILSWRARHPERVKRNRRRYVERRYADPERHQAWLDEQRMSYRLRKERNGQGLDTISHSDAKGAYRSLTHNGAAKRAERLDAAPFFAWLDFWQEQRKADRVVGVGRTSQAEAASLEELCRLAGFDATRLREARREGVVRLDLAETFLDIVDGPPIWELYDEQAVA